MANKVIATNQTHNTDNKVIITLFLLKDDKLEQNPVSSPEERFTIYKSANSILKIEKTDGSGYIDVFFTGQKFVAYKYSFGLVSSYISNYLVERGTISKNQDVYFSIGYYDGRIEMYTSLLD